VSFDVDKTEFWETFAEIAADPNRGLDGAMGWAWSALHWTQQELRTRETENHKLRDTLGWVEQQCPGKCAAVCDEALRAKPSPLMTQPLAPVAVWDVGEWDVEKKQAELREQISSENDAKLAAFIKEVLDAQADMLPNPLTEKP
jgi:hypothetical protein